MQYTHFSIEERETIQQGLWERRSLRAIARSLHRSHASVLREVARNRPPLKDRYTPRLAHERAQKKRRSRGRRERLKNERIRSHVVENLKRRRSPEQIAGCIRNDIHESISHESIYRFIYAQISYDKPKRGCEDLRPFLRQRRARRVHHGMRACQRVAKPLGASIDDRPDIVARRARIGDWESDTVESKDHAPGLNTLVERKTGLVLITKLHAKTGAATRAAITMRLLRFPPHLRRTITFDNGPENRDWHPIEDATGARCFFAHPYHSWERGTNENTNGLIRDYFPKKTDFRTITDEEIAYVERELNLRPRKRLGWKTPLEIMSGALEG